MQKRILTGVKPTGAPHIGNYLGAIRPALELATKHDSFLFIADLHALTITPTPAELKEHVYGVAATGVSRGVEREQAVLYGHSEFPEISNLAWLLACLSP